MGDERWTLFVGRDHANASRHDLGSTLCLSMLQRMNDANVNVELASDIPPRERPYWLVGTPILVNESTGERATGFAALNLLTDLAFRQARHAPVAKANPLRRAPPARPPSNPSASIPSGPVSAVPAQADGEASGMEELWTASEFVETSTGTESKLTASDLEAALRERNDSARPSAEQSPSPLTPLDD
jgi:hypothetical protein